MNFLPSVLASLASVASLYGGYRAYKDAGERADLMRAENARNAKIRADAVRKTQARNRAALSGSGLAFRGSPQILLEDDEAMAASDLQHQAGIDQRRQGVADNAPLGALFGGVGQSALIGYNSRDLFK